MMITNGFVYTILKPVEQAREADKPRDAELYYGVREWRLNFDNTQLDAIQGD